MNCNLKRLALAFLWVSLLGGWTEAGAVTITAATCNKADVRTAIRTANNGDTVVIPNGICHWQSTGAGFWGDYAGIGSYCSNFNLPVSNSTPDWSFCRSSTSGDTKWITIQGQGIGQTIIYDDISKDADPDGLIDWALSPGGLSRITGIEFRGGAYTVGCAGLQQSNLLVNGDSNQFRVDHNKFVSSPPCPLWNFGRANGGTVPSGGGRGAYVRGVVDHNVFDVSKSVNTLATNPIGAIGMFNGSGWANIGCCGDNSWANPDTVGTAEALYFEDNVFLNDQTVFKFGSSGTGLFCLDGQSGFRVVFRHNNLRACSIGGHGTESGGNQRGMRQEEFYKNTFTGPNGCVNLIDATGCTAWDLGGTFGITSVMSARSGVGIAFDNTITYTNGSILNAFDFSDFRESINYPIWGLCNGSNVFDQNTPGQNGYKCIDQPGASYGDLMNSGVTPPYICSDPPACTTGSPGWPHQNINGGQPGYTWSNLINGSPAFGNGTNPNVQLNRDFFNATRPFKGDGITPYCSDGNNCLTTDPFTYPHPLVGANNAPPGPPTNLRISQHRSP